MNRRTFLQMTGAVLTTLGIKSATAETEEIVYTSTIEPAAELVPHYGTNELLWMNDMGLIDHKTALEMSQQSGET